jgi:hypothetical protein
MLKNLVTMVCLNLVKDKFFEKPIIIGYTLFKIKVIKTVIDDGSSWTEGLDEHGNTVKVRSEFVFKTEANAVAAANQILENSRTQLVTLYQNIMTRLETVERAMMVEPEYFDALKKK